LAWEAQMMSLAALHLFLQHGVVTRNHTRVSAIFECNRQNKH
jgi:hypothetical protein